MKISTKIFFNIKKLELKNIIAEMKNLLMRFKGRLHQVGERIHKHEDKIIKIIKSEEQKSEQGMWETIKQTNICIVRVPEEEREKEAKRIFEEIRAESFQNFMKDMNTNIQAVQ